MPQGIFPNLPPKAPAPTKQQQEDYDKVVREEQAKWDWKRRFAAGVLEGLGGASSLDTAGKPATAEDYGKGTVDILGALPSEAVMIPAMLFNKSLRLARTEQTLRGLKSLGPDFEKGAEILANRYPRVMAHVDNVSNRMPRGTEFADAATTSYGGKTSTIDFNRGVLANEYSRANDMAHELTHAAQNIFVKGEFEKAKTQKSMDFVPRAKENLENWDTSPGYAEYFSQPFEISARVGGHRNVARMVANDPNLSSSKLKGLDYKVTQPETNSDLGKRIVLPNELRAELKNRYRVFDTRNRKDIGQFKDLDSMLSFINAHPDEKYLDWDLVK